MTFGERVRQSRTQRGMSIRELSAATGLSDTYIRDIEAGLRNRRPSFETMRLLATALGVSIEYLAGEEDRGSVSDVGRELEGVDVNLLAIKREKPESFRALKVLIAEIKRDAERGLGPMQSDGA